MALVIDDRVRETTTVTGTNDATLLGAVTGFQAFSVIGNGNTTYYTISDQSGGNWEVGIGTYSSVGPTLARTTVLTSSNSGAKVSFPAGTKDVFVTYPSDKAVYLDASGDVQPALGTVNATTVDTTNLEVTNLKAKDGTAAGSIANSTGVVTLASSVLTTTDINGGTIDGTTIGGASAAAGNFTTLGATGVATFSAGTVSAPAITTTGDTNTGIFFPAADTIAFTEGGVESMRIDSSGNLGLGVTPSAWGSGQRAFQIRNSALMSFDNNDSTLVHNAFHNGTNWVYSATGFASDFQLSGGGAKWFTAPSGTAGNTVTFTQAMTLDADGDLGIGTSSPTYKLDIVGGNIWRGTSAGSSSALYISGGVPFLGTTTNTAQCFITNDTERMRITSTGEVGVGTSAPTPIGGGYGTVDIRGSTGGGILFGNSTDFGYLYADSNGTYCGTVTAKALRFYTTNIERMRITASGDIETKGGVVYFGASNTGDIFVSPSVGSMFIEYPTAHALVFRTQAGTENMRIVGSSGNVGIGTSSPNEKLTVFGNGYHNGSGNTVTTFWATDATIGNGSGYCQWNTSINTFIVGSYSNHPTYFVTNNTERMRITSAGRVSVGTTEANRILNAYESETTTNSSTSFWNATYAGIYLRNTSDTTNVLTGIGFSSGSSGLSASGIANVAESLSLGALAFYTGGQGISNTVPERMRIDSSGNVGIGKTPTDKPLEVYSAGNTAIRIQNATTGSGANDGLLIEVGGLNALMYNYEAGHIAFGTSNTERMRITSDGNLLVGTTNNNAKLHISGSSTTDNFGTLYVINENTAADACIAAFVTATNSSATSNVYIKFGINSYAAGGGQINADGSGQAAFGSFSDSRLKENIKDLPPQLVNITALRPVEFDYIESAGGGHQTGFIAQEMQEIYPDAVGERSDGILTVTGWSKTEARLVKAIQEQQTLIENLTTRLNALEGN